MPEDLRDPDLVVRMLQDQSGQAGKPQPGLMERLRPYWNGEALFNYGVPNLSYDERQKHYSGPRPPQFRKMPDGSVRYVPDDVLREFGEPLHNQNAYEYWQQSRGK